MFYIFRKKKELYIISIICILLNSFSANKNTTEEIKFRNMNIAFSNRSIDTDVTIKVNSDAFNYSDNNFSEDESNKLKNIYQDICTVLKLDDRDQIIEFFKKNSIIDKKIIKIIVKTESSISFLKVRDMPEEIQFGLDYLQQEKIDKMKLYFYLYIKRQYSDLSDIFLFRKKKLAELTEKIKKIEKMLTEEQSYKLLFTEKFDDLNSLFADINLVIKEQNTDNNIISIMKKRKIDIKNKVSDSFKFYYKNTLTQNNSLGLSKENLQEFINSSIDPDELSKLVIFKENEIDYTYAEEIEQCSPGLLNLIKEDTDLKEFHPDDLKVYFLLSMNDYLNKVIEENKKSQKQTVLVLQSKSLDLFTDHSLKHLNITFNTISIDLKEVISIKTDKEKLNDQNKKKIISFYKKYDIDSKNELNEDYLICDKNYLLNKNEKKLTDRLEDFSIETLQIYFFYYMNSLFNKQKKDLILLQDSLIKLNPELEKLTKNLIDLDSLVNDIFQLTSLSITKDNIIKYYTKYNINGNEEISTEFNLYDEQYKFLKKDNKLGEVNKSFAIENLKIYFLIYMRDKFLPKIKEFDTESENMLTKLKDEFFELQKNYNTTKEFNDKSIDQNNDKIFTDSKAILNSNKNKEIITLFNSLSIDTTQNVDTEFLYYNENKNTSIKKKSLNNIDKETCPIKVLKIYFLLYIKKTLLSIIESTKEKQKILQAEEAKKREEKVIRAREEQAAIEEKAREELETKYKSFSEKLSLSIEKIQNKDVENTFRKIKILAKEKTTKKLQQEREGQKQEAVERETKDKEAREIKERKRQEEIIDTKAREQEVKLQEMKETRERLEKERQEKKAQKCPEKEEIEKEKTTQKELETIFNNIQKPMITKNNMIALKKQYSNLLEHDISVLTTLINREERSKVIELYKKFNITGTTIVNQEFIYFNTNTRKYAKGGSLSGNNFDDFSQESLRIHLFIYIQNVYLPPKIKAQREQEEEKKRKTEEEIIAKEAIEKERVRAVEQEREKIERELETKNKETQELKIREQQLEREREEREIETKNKEVQELEAKKRLEKEREIKLQEEIIARELTEKTEKAKLEEENRQLKAKLQETRAQEEREAKIVKQLQEEEKAKETKQLEKQEEREKTDKEGTREKEREIKLQEEITARELTEKTEREKLEEENRQLKAKLQETREQEAQEEKKKQEQEKIETAERKTLNKLVKILFNENINELAKREIFLNKLNSGKKGNKPLKEIINKDYFSKSLIGLGSLTVIGGLGLLKKHSRIAKIGIGAGTAFLGTGIIKNYLRNNLITKIEALKKSNYENITVSELRNKIAEAYAK